MTHPPTPQKQDVQVNKIASIVNNYFLDSEYDGKDWEAVRKGLIADLSLSISQARNQDRDKIARWLVEEDYIGVIGPKENGIKRVRGDMEKALSPKEGGKDL